MTARPKSPAARANRVLLLVITAVVTVSLVLGSFI